jgi:uncharacterized coiled-coil DUF342 family protein
MRQRRDGFLGMPTSVTVRRTKEFALSTAVQAYKDTLGVVGEANDLANRMVQLRTEFDELRAKADKTKSKKKANQYYKEASEKFLEAKVVSERLTELESAIGD